MTYTKPRYGDHVIAAEQQPGGRWKFIVRMVGEHKTSRSLRTWATKAGAIRAGRREFRV